MGVVWIADAASGSRPGARYEPHEGYVKRMDKIEEIVKGFEGVDQAYAFQAGRDVRVFVDPNEVDDAWNAGVEFSFRTIVRSIVGDEKVKGVRCVKIRWHEKVKGMPRAYDVEGAEFLSRVTM